VAALNALAAAPAATDVHVELAVDWRARNLGLELVADGGFDERAVAVRAIVG